jgi:anthranilate phosphoribosyltransferase
MNTFREVLDKAIRGEHLTVEETEHVFQRVMNGGATPAHIAGLLVALKMNGETVEEISTAASVLRHKMKKLPVSDDVRERAIDTCGTGGDGKGTYNISTTVAFVVAGCGVPVAKHGNRAVSSKSGSSDVLEALGVNLDAGVDFVARALEEAGICFMMAPHYHSAMRHVGPVRQELKIRTIFNLLGPLINPAEPKNQLMGVYEKQWCEPIAHVLKNLGTESAWVVHGMDGIDEISLMDETYVAQLKDGEVTTFSIKPEDFGFERLEDIEPLIGSDAYVNAQALKNVLGGADNAYADVVLLNSAAALIVAGKAEDMKQGLQLARESISSGAAKNALHKLVEITNLDGLGE